MYTSLQGIKGLLNMDEFIHVYYKIPFRPHLPCPSFIRFVYQCEMHVICFITYLMAWKRNVTNFYEVPRIHTLNINVFVCHI